MARPRYSELDAVCPRCGENVILILYKEPATHDDPEQSEVEEYTCDCGADVIHESEGMGIKEVLYEVLGLDADGYIKVYDFDYNEEETSWHLAKSLEEIAKDYGKPSDEIKYFIKGLRPDSFEPFRLWNGTLIECQ